MANIKISIGRDEYLKLISGDILTVTHENTTVDIALKDIGFDMMRALLEYVAKQNNVNA